MEFDRPRLRLAGAMLAGLAALLSGIRAHARPSAVVASSAAQSSQAQPRGRFLVVASPVAGSIGVYSVARDGGLEEIPGSPFDALTGVDTVRFCGEDTLVASASRSDQIGSPSQMAVFHLAKNGGLSAAGSVVPIPKDVRPWAGVQQGARRFVFVPAAGLPGDLLYGFELVGQGPGVVLDPLAWSPRPLTGLMLFGGAAATPDGSYVYQVGYSNSMSAYDVGPNGSSRAIDVHGAAIGQLTNAVTSSDGQHLYCTRDANPDQVAGFAIDAGGGLSALPGSPYALPSASNHPSHITMPPDGRFVIVGSIGNLITVLSRSRNGALSSTPVATLSFSETPAAVVCNDEHLFVIGNDALGVRRVFVYRLANVLGGPIHEAKVHPYARDLALSRTGL